MTEPCCPGRWNGAGVECDETCDCPECQTWREEQE